MGDDARRQAFFTVFVAILMKRMVDKNREVMSYVMGAVFWSTRATEKHPSVAAHLLSSFLLFSSCNPAFAAFAVALALTVL